MPGFQSWTGTPILANGTTLVRTGPGVLHGISINTKGASSNTIKIYDGLTAGGTLKATIDSTITTGPWMFDMDFITGLTIVIATGTAADITVLWTAR